MLLFHRSNWCDGPCDSWKACMLFVVTVKGWLKMRDPGCERNHVWLYPNTFLHVSCPVSSGLTAGWELWAGYGRVGVAGQNRDWAKQTQWGSIPNYKLSIIQWGKVRYLVHKSTTGQNLLPNVYRSFQGTTYIQHYVCQPFASATLWARLEFRWKDNAIEIHCVVEMQA